MMKNTQLYPVNNGQIKIGKHNLQLDTDKIIHITPVGDVDANEGDAIKRGVFNLIHTAGGNVNIIGDLNKAGKPSSKTRKIGIELFQDSRINKVALFGLHPVARIIASFIIGGSIKKDIRFLKTEEEALTWLKEESNTVT
ncbi:MAG: STAS/SEC14 domain-containing protein [Marinilabiliaceae bacterium]|nr:STAS/SEC14 domain-containing protein [Marinilabiliaceae bacterium]